MRKLREVQKKSDKKKGKINEKTKINNIKKDDELSIFSDIDVLQIDEEKKREKMYNRKCELIRKLYYRSK